MTKPSLREQMPLVTEFIDAFRDAFGAAQINASIKSGIDGQPNFYAREAGHVVGTQATGQGVLLAQMQIGPAEVSTPIIGARK